jgi:hypothetical protein
MAFLPFILLTILTTLILYELKQRKTCKVVNRSVSVSETFHEYVVINEQAADADSGSSPMVLVLVVLLFLGCSFISLLVNLCDMFEGYSILIVSNYYNFRSLSPTVQMALIDVGNFLVIVNASANFLIYMSSNAHFRNQVIDLFGLHKRFKKAQITQI